MSKKKINEREAAQAEIEKVKKDEARIGAASEWIKTTPISEFSAMFTEYIEEVTAVASNPNVLAENCKISYFSVIDNVETIQRLWMQIDKQNLNDKNLLFMYDLINNDLLQIIKSYIYNAVGHSIQASYNNNKADKSPSVRADLAKIIDFLYTLKTNQNRLKLPFKKVIRNNGEVISFPKFSTTSPLLSKSLLHLEEVWQLASSKSNSVEDEYFLEEIAINYLPESWKMYSTFKVAKREYAEQAEKLLLEQISLLENKAQSILDDSFSAALLALSAQTEFLKTKVEDTQKVEKNMSNDFVL